MVAASNTMSNSQLTPPSPTTTLNGGTLKSSASFPSPSLDGSSPKKISSPTAASDHLAPASPETSGAGHISVSNGGQRPSPSPEGRSADGSAHEERMLKISDSGGLNAGWMQQQHLSQASRSFGGTAGGSLGGSIGGGSMGANVGATERDASAIFRPVISLGEAPSTPGGMPPRSGIAGTSPEKSSVGLAGSSSVGNSNWSPSPSGNTALPNLTVNTNFNASGSNASNTNSLTILPRNPKDTPNNSSALGGIASPKRRIKGTLAANGQVHTGSVKSAFSSGGVSNKSANSKTTVGSARSQPHSQDSRKNNTLVVETVSSNIGTSSSPAIRPVSPGHANLISPNRHPHSDLHHKSQIMGGSQLKIEGREGIPPRANTHSNSSVPLTPHSTQPAPTNGLLATPNSTAGSATSLPVANTSPTMRKMSSKSRQASYGSHASQLSHISSQPQSKPESQSAATQLDDEEQFMFEQRLTQDDLGVAIRKINHSGKAQLRYVKCVPLRPPSSSEFGSGYDNRGGGGSAAIGIPYLDNALGQADKGYSGDGSVSSRSTSSSRFLERMRVSERLLSVAGRVTGSVSGHHHHHGNDHSSMNDASSTSRKHKSYREESQNANLLLHSPQREEHDSSQKSLRALTWGKKNSVTISLDRFVCVRKGKTTERTMRNACPSSRLLSIVTKDPRHESLDIEAPTRLDRDKFAFAFSKFLGVPLEEEVDGRGIAAKKKIKTPSITRSTKKKPSATISEPGRISSANTTPKVQNRSVAATASTSESLLPVLTPSSDKASDADRELGFFKDDPKQTISGSVPVKPSRDAGVTTAAPGNSSFAGDISESARKRINSEEARSESMLEPQEKRFEAPETDSAPTINAQKDRHADDASHVSSLTGGVDQEIVEELHQAIIELRAELDASRAEAARAVKVAEQAIQSAENCSSSDWNSTVTHKAAEAAALAQKKSAEAIARARMAEERLSAERKSTAFWRRQAQAAEEEAGSLKTRSAAAEVKQAVMVEELASERRKAARMFDSLKYEFMNAEKVQSEELHSANERKRQLEAELEQVKKELRNKNLENQRIIEAEQERIEREKSRASNRMRPSFSRKKRQGSNVSMSGSVIHHEETRTADQSMKEMSIKLQNDVMSLRKEHDLVRHTSIDEINSLQNLSKEWSRQAGRAVEASRAEAEYLREKLAAESAMRLKLLNELQDIRGTVRVYCRPKPCSGGEPTITIPTHDILVLNKDTAALSFKFDRVFSPSSSQHEIFSELEEPLISSLDGFNVTLLAFGQQRSGKTYSVLGDCGFDSRGQAILQCYGVQLQTLQQLFTIASHRTDRYKDTFSITIVEVHNEKLIDLVAGTPLADSDGHVVICETRRDKKDRKSVVIAESSWHKGKLEIKTNIDGNTVVQGLVTVPINSFEDACTLWQQSITKQLERLRRQGSDLKKYDKNSNIIATIHITSINVATGVGTEGKLQFVDMAASDVAPVPKKENFDINKSPDADDTHFSNKSIDAFNDVVNARCQFDRSVPYRNSTLTHLLRDSLEADAKVLLLCCVSTDQADLTDAIGTLRFASRIQKVSIGKATKHIVGSKE